MPKLSRPGPLALIACCFLASGVVRIVDNNAAIAEEVGKMAATAVVEQPETAAALSCPAPMEPESLLEAIREREAQLDKREARLANREQVLRVSRLKIEEDMKRLEDVESRLSATLARADQAAEKDIERLTSVYENMKPANAAEIFGTMDVTFAAGFLARMRPDAAASIMSNLSPEAAYAISVVLAGRNANAPTQ